MTNNMFNNICIGNLFVDTNSIIRCQASSNYTKIFFSNHKPIVLAKTLGLCEDALSNKDFIRIHQSHLINKNFIQSIEPSGKVYLNNGFICTMSRRKKREVKQILFAN